jgi:iron complex outermembrane recepter protein
MNTLISIPTQSSTMTVRLRRGAVAVAVATAIASSAIAAETTRAPSDEALQEIVVTGSRIVRRDYSSPSPVVTVGSDTLQNSADISIDQALSKLTQFNPGSNQFNQAFNVQALPSQSPGAATVNLRGLGPNRNLVLIDGRRAQPADASLAVDVNTIPQAAIEGVEIVTGGAGAAYGADALAGVVNFKLKKRFQGAEFDAQYGITGKGDNKTESVSALIGGNFAEDRGNVMLGLMYSRRGDVLVKDRPFFAARNTDPNSPGSEFFPTFPGFNFAFYNPGQTFFPVFDLNFPSQAAIDSVFSAFPAGTLARGQAFYFQPGATVGAANIFSYTAAGGFPAPGFQGQPDPNRNKFTANGSLAGNGAYDAPLSTPLQRFSLFSSANYNISENVTAELSANFVRSTLSTAFGVPVPAVNQWGIDVPYDAAHPVPAALKTLLDSRADPLAGWHLSTYPYYIGKRSLDVQTDTYQISAGLKGNLGFKDWTWDVYGSVGSTDMLAKYKGFVDLNRYQTLVSQPNYGANYTANFGLIGRLAHCTSGINPFTTTAVSQDCIDIIDARLKTTTQISQRIVEANLQGAGFNLPAGESRFAVGAGYRSDTLGYSPDPGMSATNITSNAIGIFGSQPVDGNEAVKEIYGEADLPILANLPAVKKLELNLGYRYSDYNANIGGVDTWKALVTWQVNDYVTFRGGPQRANRAPNIAELFTPSSVYVALWPVSDPCNIFTAAPYGNVASNPKRAQTIALCNQLTPPGATVIDTTFAGNIGAYFPLALDQLVGNPEVKSEEGKTLTIGTVLKLPSESPVLSGLTATIDYYNIKIDGAINPATSQIAYGQCLNGNGISNPTYDVNNAFCKLIRRTLAGNPDTTIGKYINLSSVETSGVDLNLDWHAMLGDMGMSAPGALTANLAISKLLAYKVQVAAGDQIVDYKGSTGFDAVSGAQFSWKSNLSLGYAAGPVNVSLRWRHLPSVISSGKVTNPASTVQDTDPYNQFDLFGGWKITDNVSLRAGIENLLDKDPPITGANPSGGNSGVGNTDSSIYDILGRRFFLGVKAKF